MSGAPREARFPGRAAIDGYGSGGFRFAGMSHRGSIIVLPSGIYGWPVRTAAELDAVALARPIGERDEIDLLLIGTGRDPCPLPRATAQALQDAAIDFEALPTGAAAGTYNVLFAEGRRVAAALIAID